MRKAGKHRKYTWGYWSRANRGLRKARKKDLTRTKGWQDWLKEFLRDK